MALEKVAVLLGGVARAVDLVRVVRVDRVKTAIKARKSTMDNLHL